MNQVIEFTVLGSPVAQARGRAVAMKNGKGIRVYDPKNVKDYKSKFYSAACEVAPAVPIDEPIAVWLDIYVERPASWPKRRTQACTKPDVDNFAKAALDAMESVIYKNDSRIVSLIVEKHLSDKPRVDVRIEVLGE